MTNEELADCARREDLPSRRARMLLVAIGDPLVGGDDDQREYGGVLLDGRRWSHPPYGPVQVGRPPLYPPERRRPWWRRQRP